MCAYAFDDEVVNMWEPHLGPMPERLRLALTDPTITKKSWNVGFEFGMISVKLMIALMLNQWSDPMAHARYLAYPGSLDKCGDVLGIGLEHEKSKEGKALIKLFSIPTKAKKPTKKNPEGVPAKFNDWNSHPAEWAQFVAYCIQDVVAERAIAHELDKRAEWPEIEHKIWVIDQTINQRGIPIDLDFASKALTLVENERKIILGKMTQMTGCENPNSPAQLKAWFETQGGNFASLNKEAVAEAIEEGLSLGNDLSPLAIEVLQQKQLLGGIAFKKLPVIQKWTREKRLRNAFTYHSAHTGRWASRGVQFHNLLKPTKRVGENYAAIIDAINNGTEMPYTNDAAIAAAAKKGEPWTKGRGEQIPVIEAVSGALRTAVRALEGARLFVADFSSIENRVLAWIAECPSLLAVFAHPTENDSYKAFAAQMYKILYADVTKEQRNFCKSPVLGCGFGMGAKRLVVYAKNMGQIITLEQAETLVYAWREAYPEIVAYWGDLGRACMQAVAKKAYLQLGPLKLDGRNPDLFKIVLPSGRALHYDKPEIGKDDYNRPVLTHLTEHAKFGWVRIQARGSSLVENVVQAIARDLLVNAMHNVIKAGFDIVLHVHDELVAEVLFTSLLTYKMFEHAMTQVPWWGQDIPLKVEGFEGPYYRK